MTRIRSAVIGVVLFGCIAGTGAQGAEKWPGIDDAVVNRIAKEHGREARSSFLPEAEGDLQLFLFLLAGAIGGFAAGYYWRVLLEGKKK